MMTLEDALEDCLARLARGEATLADCLARYPEHASELRRLLHASAELERGRAVRLLPTRKARQRAQLVARLSDRLRRWPLLAIFFSGSYRRVFSGAALIVILLLASTGAAQAALPGDFLYSWKLTSEKVWRVLSPDPLLVDLEVARRRADELKAVAGDANREPLAQQNYQQSLVDLNQYVDLAEREVIATTLVYQQVELEQAGLTVPELESLISLMQPITDTPTAPAAILETPSPLPLSTLTISPQPPSFTPVATLEPTQPLPTISLSVTLLPSTSTGSTSLASTAMPTGSTSLVPTVLPSVKPILQVTVVPLPTEPLPTQPLSPLVLPGLTPIPRPPQ